MSAHDYYRTARGSGPYTVQPGLQQLTLYGTTMEIKHYLEIVSRVNAHQDKFINTTIDQSLTLISLQPLFEDVS